MANRSCGFGFARVVGEQSDHSPQNIRPDNKFFSHKNHIIDVFLDRKNKNNVHFTIPCFHGDYFLIMRKTAFFVAKRLFS